MSTRGTKIFDCSIEAIAPNGEVVKRFLYPERWSRRAVLAYLTIAERELSKGWMPAGTRIMLRYHRAPHRTYVGLFEARAFLEQRIDTAGGHDGSHSLR